MTHTALCRNLAAMAALTSSAPGQYSDQSTPMKLLFLLLNSLPSFLHYVASSPRDTPSLPSRDASTRCPYTECYRNSINTSKDYMQLIGEEKGKIEFTQASSRI